MPDDAAAAPRSRLPIRVAQVLLGVVLGLIVAEGVFWWRDDGAFPHVNFYVEDPQLAVRLEKDASERLAFGGNPTTTIGTNSLGYRTHAGSDDGAWPAPGTGAGKGDVLVVGDSQVYGLGVEGTDTFSAKLAALTGRTVINAGVPTYGPQEYAAVVEEVLQTRKVDRVVFVVNVANDLFELAHPNSERHAMWDGWAVRKETAPATPPTSFPGRRLLFSKSHLVFAIRAALHDIQTTEVQPEHAAVGTAVTGVPSEGHWTDLVASGVKSNERKAAIPPTQRPTDARIDAIQKVIDLEGKLDDKLAEHIDAPIRYENDERLIDEAVALAERRGRPADIVVDENAEAGRYMSQTATALLAGAIVRQRQYDELRKKAASNATLKKLLSDRDAAVAAVDDAASHAIVGAAAAPLSPLAMLLERVRKSCDAVGARLVVVALPVDVMVSAEEWKKYRTEPKDMTPTKVLLDDIVADAVRVGATGIDVMPALVAAEPGAFLDRDLHMTPKGHEAVAAAIAARLAELPALRQPRVGYEAGTSAVPAQWEWERVGEITVKGSSAAGCETKQIREWVKVACLAWVGGTPTGVDVKSGGEGDAHAVFAHDVSVLLAPVRKGKRIEARFFWKTHAKDLVIDWPASAPSASLVFGTKLPAERRAQLPTDVVAMTEQACDRFATPMYCGTMFGSIEPACLVERNDGHYHSSLDCLQMQPATLPVCPDGTAPMFATLRCRTLCDADRPCGGDDVCSPWQSASACLPKSAFSPAAP